MTTRVAEDCSVGKNSCSPGRRLIKIARMRFSGIAAAIVGRFSTAYHHPIRFSLCVSPSPVPLQPALFPTLYHPSPPLQSSRPRLARPFDMVYASGIQMTAFARAEECPTISAWLRPPTTTRLHRGIRSLVSSFFFPPPLPSPPSPLSFVMRRIQQHVIASLHPLSFVSTIVSTVY